MKPSDNDQGQGDIQKLKDRIQELENELEIKGKYILHLEGRIAEITPLRRHAKRQVKQKLRGINSKIVGSLQSRNQYVPATAPQSDDALLQAAQATDRQNFAQYNKATKDPALLKVYIRTRSLAAKVLNKALRGRL